MQLSGLQDALKKVILLYKAEADDLDDSLRPAHRACASIDYVRRKLFFAITRELRRDN